ncbi:MAG: CidA/LrgA family protein [Spirochaetales bacterium]
MFGGLVILMVFLAVGEFLAALGVPLPGNVIGMILLSAALLSGWLSIDSIKTASDVLLDNLSFLFVPPGVGIMVHASLIADHWIAVAVAIVVSTVLVTITVGALQQLLSRGNPAPCDTSAAPGQQDGSSDDA